MKDLSVYSACFCVVCFSSELSAQTMVVIETSLGDIPMTLFDSEAPETVANFLGYVERGDYENSIFHRLVDNFVLQGGGFGVTDASSSFIVEAIEVVVPVVNEAGISNTRGTVAMAKLGDDPDSATSQWFVNLSDNSENLDEQNGGFTVFGEVTDMTVVDEIAARPVGVFQNPFSDLPLLSFDPETEVERSDLIVIESVTIVPEPSTSSMIGLLFGFGLFRRSR